MSSSDRVAGVDGEIDPKLSTSSLMDDEFDTLVEKLLDEYHAPGLSIAIFHNGEIQFKV